MIAQINLSASAVTQIESRTWIDIKTLRVKWTVCLQSEHVSLKVLHDLHVPQANLHTSWKLEPCMLTFIDSLSPGSDRFPNDNTIQLQILQILQPLLLLSPLSMTM